MRTFTAILTVATILGSSALHAQSSGPTNQVGTKGTKSTNHATTILVAVTAVGLAATVGGLAASSAGHQGSFNH